MTRSRRAGLSRDEVRRQPLYARMLGLQYLAPSGFLCFVFLEGAVALGILLALAELVSWWGVLVLPVTVAVMVKLNDVVAGALTRTSSAVAPLGASVGAPIGRSGTVGSSGLPAGTGFEAAGGAQVSGLDGGRFAASGFAGGGRPASTFTAGGATTGGSPLGGRGAVSGLGGPAGGRGGLNSPGAETVRLPPSMIAQPGGALSPAADPPRGSATGDDVRRHDIPFPEPYPADAPTRFLTDLNPPHRPATPDDQQQRARQSAARRYE